MKKKVILNKKNKKFIIEILFKDVTTLDEKMDTKSIYTFEDVFDKETNVENFFNYKINNMLIRKKDSNRLLNNEWLSEHVN